MGSVEVRIDALIVILKVLSSTGAGCFIYILFPIPAIRFSHRDTSTGFLAGTHGLGRALARPRGYNPST
jgi:hypothetical protein